MGQGGARHPTGPPPRAPSGQLRARQDGASGHRLAKSSFSPGTKWEKEKRNPLCTWCSLTFPPELILVTNLATGRDCNLNNSSSVLLSADHGDPVPGVRNQVLSQRSNDSGHLFPGR